MKKLFQALTASLLLASTTTLAAAFNCSVDLNLVLINANGAVNVHHSGRGEYTHICNLTTERQGVGIATCAIWTSMLLNLKNGSKKALFSYDTAVASSCANLPIYEAAPAPVYIGAL